MRGSGFNICCARTVGVRTQRPATADRSEMLRRASARGVSRKGEGPQGYLRASMVELSGVEPLTS